jgi:hypothetical protein
MGNLFSKSTTKPAADAKSTEVSPSGEEAGNDGSAAPLVAEPTTAASETPPSSSPVGTEDAKQPEQTGSSTDQEVQETTTTTTTSHVVPEQQKEAPHVQQQTEGFDETTFETVVPSDDGDAVLAAGEVAAADDVKIVMERIVVDEVPVGSVAQQEVENKVTESAVEWSEATVSTAEALSPPKAEDAPPPLPSAETFPHDTASHVAEDTTPAAVSACDFDVLMDGERLEVAEQGDAGIGGGSVVAESCREEHPAAAVSGTAAEPDAVVESDEVEDKKMEEVDEEGIIELERKTKEMEIVASLGETGAADDDVIGMSDEVIRIQ